MRLLTRNAGKIAFVVLGLFLALSFKLAWDDSLTFDEVAHIPAGYSYVKEFDYRLNPEHPPLLKVLAGLPLLALDPKFDTDAPFWTGTGTDYPGEYGQWSAGHYLLDNAANPDLLIFLARLPLVLVAAAFGWLLFVWGRRLAGAIGGLLALALYAFSPNVLGHAHLVTTDVGIAAAMTAAFFFFINFLKRPSWRNAILAGIFLGVAQVTKFSAVMLYPIFGVLALLYPLFVRYANKRVSGLGRLSIIAQYLRSFCALIISLAVIWVVYAPWTVTMPENVLETLAISKIPDTTSVRDSAFRSFILGANQNALTRPLAMYAQGLIQVFHRVEGGNGAYFLGTVSSDANPWYFPTVFLIKETWPHLALMIIALLVAAVFSIKRVFVALRSGPKNASRELFNYLVYHPSQYVLLAFVVFYAYISITGNLTIGYRHLFPIVPLVYLLTAVVIARAIKRLARSGCGCDRTLITIVGILLALLFWDLARAYPSYLSYFNPAVGGPSRGYRLVTDSNADWGQDLKRLNEWIKNYNADCPRLKVIKNKVCYELYRRTGRPVKIDKIRVDYFGGDNPARRLGAVYKKWWDSRRPIEPGWYAISVNYRQGSIYERGRTKFNSYRWLRRLRPVGRAGTSILIYYLTPEEASAINEEFSPSTR